jgi:protein-S-isoprenylcysteine O-methyltransferase Ste14
MKLNKEELVSPLVASALVLSGLWLSFLYLEPLPVLPENDFLPFLSFLSFLNWLYFFVGATSVHRQASSSVAGINRLIESGVYAYVRHPIYSANIILAWGLFFLLPTLPCLVSVLWLMAVLSAWACLEEKFLSLKFGLAYDDYRRRVPMFVPRYFHKR